MIKPTARHDLVAHDPTLPPTSVYYCTVHTLSHPTRGDRINQSSSHFSSFIYHTRLITPSFQPLLSLLHVLVNAFRFPFFSFMFLPTWRTDLYVPVVSLPSLLCSLHSSHHCFAIPSPELAPILVLFLSHMLFFLSQQMHNCVLLQNGVREWTDCTTGRKNGQVIRIDDSGSDAEG